MTAFIETARPAGKSQGYVFDLFCVLGGSLFLALISQVSIPLWFTPVPITLQTFGLMLLAGVLGSKRGALAVLLYLSEGALGLPVLAGAGSGILHFIGPTGGYLFSFALSTYVMGLLLERGWQNRYFLTCAAFALGNALTLIFGALWLSQFVGLERALVLGIYPFLLGGALKIIAAGALIPSGGRVLKHLKGNE